MNWLKDINFFDDYYLPVQYRVNLNLYTAAILKKYIAKSYIENRNQIKNLSLDDIVIPGINIWKTPDCFESFASACLCFLYFLEDIMI